MNAHSSPLLGSRRLSPLTEATSSCAFISCTAQLCRLYKVCNLYANILWKILDVHWHNMDLLQNDSLHLLMSKNIKESYCTLFAKYFRSHLHFLQAMKVCSWSAEGEQIALWDEAETCFLLYVIFILVPSHLIPCWHVNMIEGHGGVFSKINDHMILSIEDI